MRFLPLVLPLFLIALPLLSRTSPGSGARKYLPLQQPESAPKTGLQPVDFAPLSYYDGKCARCHGLEGSNYGDILKGKDDKALHDGIDAMAKGPGQAPLDESQLQIMTAWHRALVENAPFVHLMKVERGDKTMLSGEATPDAKVILKSGASSFEAARDGVSWKIEAPKDLDLDKAELSATK